MARILRVSGASLAAMVLLSLVWAAASPADDFTAESYPVTLTGSGDGGVPFEIATTAGTVKANKTTYTGTVTSAATVMQLAPTLTEGTGFGFPVTFELNGCVFNFNVAGGPSTSGDMDIVCPAGSEFTIKAESAGTTKCVVHIPPQTDIGGTVTYTNLNLGATREITASASLTGLDYSHTGSGGVGSGLGVCTTGSATNGTMLLKTVLTGERSSHVGVFLT